MPLDNIRTTHPFIPPSPVIIYTAPLLNHSRVCGSSQFRIPPLSVKRQASRGLPSGATLLSAATIGRLMAASHCMSQQRRGNRGGIHCFMGLGDLPPSLPHQRKSVYLGNRQVGLPERPPPAFLPPPRKAPDRSISASQPASPDSRSATCHNPSVTSSKALCPSCQPALPVTRAFFPLPKER